MKVQLRLLIASSRLVALNKVRAAEEAKDLIRWLRPEFQAPGAAAPQVNATLDLGDTPAAARATVIPWPKTLAEQVSTVAAILAASQTPQHPSEIARAIKGTNAKGVAPVLDALAAIGQARKLSLPGFASCPSQPSPRSGSGSRQRCLLPLHRSFPA